MLIGFGFHQTNQSQATTRPVLASKASGWFGFGFGPDNQSQLKAN
jgi:hypothetical protein